MGGRGEWFGSGGGFGLGGQGGCERRIEVLGKIQKIYIFFFLGGWVGGGVGLEVRVDVNEILKFLGKLTKKNRGGGGREGAVKWGIGLVGGVRVDVNAMLGVGSDVGYGGCEPRIEGIVQCTKRYYTIVRKLKKWGGEGEGNI